ncbi:hypothetical protein V6N12_037081, partial [Hibiscus sabdariffa]
FIRSGFTDCIPEEGGNDNLSRKSKHYMKKLVPDGTGITADMHLNENATT